MSQYTTGSVSVTNASAAVVGTTTAWSGEVAAGDLFIVVGQGIVYTVASVTDDTHLSLTAPYGQATSSSANYVLARDFSPINDIPLMGRGDRETAAIYNQMVAIVDSLL